MKRTRLRKNIKNLLEKAREASILAVNVYNNPVTVFRTSAYIVLMNIAWTSLLHAIYEMRGVKYYYKNPKDRRKYIRVEGDPKTWDLIKCASEYFKDGDNPMYINIKFFVGLRNKIEHKYAPKIDRYIFGECQSYLLNFEEILVQEFGSNYAIADNLLFALQYSRIRTNEQISSIKSIQTKNFREIKDYIDNFRKGLNSSLINDPKYSFRVFLIPKIGNRITSSDIAVEFVKFDPKNPEQMSQCDRIITIIKEKRVTDKSKVAFKQGISDKDKASKVLFIKDEGSDILPKVGITHDPDKASGVYVIEKISEDMFEDASKIVEAGHILDKRFGQCPFSKNSLYFIYGSRFNIKDVNAPSLLLKYSLQNYCPFCHWLLKIDRAAMSNFFRKILNGTNSNHILSVMKVFIATQHQEWLNKILSMAREVETNTQKPCWYWSLQKLLKPNSKLPTIYKAIGMQPSQELCGKRLDYWMNNIEEAQKMLSRLCLKFAEGGKYDSLIIRKLDLIVNFNQLSKYPAFKNSFLVAKET